MVSFSNITDYSLVIINYLPTLLFALTVLVIGWLIAVFLGKIVAEILKKVKLDDFLNSYGWQDVLERARIKMTVSEFIGGLVKWIVVILVISVCAEVLGLTQFTQLLQKFVAWIPTLLVALLILVVAFIVADLLDKIVRSFSEKAQLKAGNTLAALLRWAIYVTAFLIALSQLKIAEKFINTLFTGIVATLALAFGLAFGLGGKSVAEDLLRDLQKKIQDKE